MQSLKKFFWRNWLIINPLMSGSLVVDLFFQETVGISWRMVKTKKIELVMLKWNWSGALGWQQNNTWCMGIWRYLFCYLECIEAMGLIIGWFGSFWIAYISQMHVLVVVVELVYKRALDSCTMFSSWILIHAFLGFLFIGSKGFIYFP